MSKESNMVPRCENCGYTEKDCREQMDHHLCGFPEPAAAHQPPALGGEPEETFSDRLSFLGTIDRCDVACGSYGDKFHRWDDAGPYVEYEDHVKHVDLYKQEIERLSAHLAPLQAEIERLTTDRDYCKRVAVHNKEVGDQLKARCDELEALLSKVISSGKLLDDRLAEGEDHALEADICAALSKPAGREQ